MAGCRNLLLMTALAFVGISYYLYVPPYEGFEEKFTLGLLLSVFKLVRLYVSICVELGLGTHYEIARSAMANSAKANDNYSLEVTDSIFDNVPVRLYRPTGYDDEQLAGVIFMHGGGWFTGNLDICDSFTRKIAADLNAIVISVGYRLSPEFRFPLPFQDCETACLHLMNNARKYGVDPSRIAIAGDSSGGNLAAAVALKLRYRQPAIKLQLLMYPVLQGIDFATPSYQINAEDAILSRHDMLLNFIYYAQGNNTKHFQALLRNEHTTPIIKQTMAKSLLSHESIAAVYKTDLYQPPRLDIGNETVWRDLLETFLNPYFAPLLANNLTGVAPAVIVTCGKDVLRDDGLLYDHRLREAGTSTHLLHYDYAFHAFLHFHEFLSKADVAFSEIMQVVRNKL